MIQASEKSLQLGMCENDGRHYPQRDQPQGDSIYPITKGATKVKTDL